MTPNLLSVDPPGRRAEVVLDSQHDLLVVEHLKFIGAKMRAGADQAHQQTDRSVGASAPVNERRPENDSVASPTA